MILRHFRYYYAFIVTLPPLLLFAMLFMPFRFHYAADDAFIDAVFAAIFFAIDMLRHFFDILPIRLFFFRSFSCRRRHAFAIFTRHYCR